jgi:hypothetical protein
MLLIRASGARRYIYPTGIDVAKLIVRPRRGLTGYENDCENYLMVWKNRFKAFEVLGVDGVMRGTFVSTELTT